MCVLCVVCLQVRKSVLQRTLMLPPAAIGQSAGSSPSTAAAAAATAVDPTLADFRNALMSSTPSSNSVTPNSSSGGDVTDTSVNQLTNELLSYSTGSPTRDKLRHKLMKRRQRKGSKII